MFMLKENHVHFPEDALYQREDLPLLFWRR